jgi:hypothetical protein
MNNNNLGHFDIDIFPISLLYTINNNKCSDVSSKEEDLNSVSTLPSKKTSIFCKTLHRYASTNASFRSTSKRIFNTKRKFASASAWTEAMNTFEFWTILKDDD